MGRFTGGSSSLSQSRRVYWVFQRGFFTPFQSGAWIWGVSQGVLHPFLNQGREYWVFQRGFFALFQSEAWVGVFHRGFFIPFSIRGLCMGDFTGGSSPLFNQ